MARNTPQSYTQTFSGMKENPIYQQRWSEIATQGQDKRAVSNLNRVMGADLAQESQRLMQASQAGEELARRSDRLGFEKKVQDFKEKQFEDTIARQDQQFVESQRRQIEAFDWDVLKKEHDRDTKNEMYQEDLALRYEALSNKTSLEQAKIDMDDSNFGMEFALGLMSTGTEIWGDYKSNKYQQKEDQLIESRQWVADEEQDRIVDFRNSIYLDTNPIEGVD